MTGVTGLSGRPAVNLAVRVHRNTIVDVTTLAPSMEGDRVGATSFRGSRASWETAKVGRGFDSLVFLCAI